MEDNKAQSVRLAIGLHAFKCKGLITSANRSSEHSVFVFSVCCTLFMSVHMNEALMFLCGSSVLTFVRVSGECCTAKKYLQILRVIQALAG